MMTVAALISALVWLYLCFLHKRFWHADQRLETETPKLKTWPTVAIVIPARDEAESIGETVRSLLDQDYAGDYRILVIDDNSTDGTAACANSVPQTDHEKSRLKVLSGNPLADGWVGKMWAVSQGIEAAGETDYLLLTDADIRHSADNLSKLVSKAEQEGLGLVSLMVKLRCQSFWERFLIPAFIYFFQKLYPFPAVNDPRSKTAAAAGGCMLVERKTLMEVGGIESIKDQLIDDCALARKIKALKPVWLGLGEDTESIRSYDDLSPVWHMVARSAYVQLSYNPIWLLGTVLGMALLYIVPPIAIAAGALLKDMQLLTIGGVAWLLMTWTYLPTLNLYKSRSLWALTLPFSGLLYTLMTIDSARRYYMGGGAEWKGRSYAD